MTFQASMVTCLFYLSLLVVAMTATSSSSGVTVVSSFCGFPSEANINGVCARHANDEQECSDSYYVSAIPCYWDIDFQKCTSSAVLTNEDPFCPTIVDEETCQDFHFFGFRQCVWHSATTSEPSASPSEPPSLEPSTAPSSLATEYCGIPFLKDPWALPRQLCSNATNMVDCLRSFVTTSVKCFWAMDGTCTSELVDTGEDALCPLVGEAQTCNTVSHTLNRQCYWYEPQGPSPSPSTAPSVSPSSSPSTFSPTTEQPTSSPTRNPTASQPPPPVDRPLLRPFPVIPAPSPTPRPPTEKPTSSPTMDPSTNPSDSPTDEPSTEPSTTSLAPLTPPTVSEPLPIPTQEPTTLHPSESPSHAPTVTPSQVPSGSPTLIPIDDLISVCRCDRQVQCQDGPLDEGDDFLLCIKTTTTENATVLITLESIVSLQLIKNPVQQWIVRDGTWIEGSFFVESSPVSMILSIGIRDAFFAANVGTTQALLVDGHVQYLRSDETGTFLFQHNVSIRNAPQVDPIVGNQPDEDRETIDEAASQGDKQKRSRKFNLKLWTPIAVVLAILIVLTIKLVVDTHQDVQ